MDRIAIILIVSICAMTITSEGHGDELTEAQASEYICARGGKVLPASGKKITEVFFIEATIKDDDLKVLESMKHIEFILFEACKKIGGPGICYLSTLPNLTIVRFKECDGLSDAGLKAIAKLKHLKVLEIKACPGIGGVGLRALAGLSTLERLELEGNKSLKASDFKEIGSLRQLQELEIYDESFHNVSDETIATWTDMKLLRSVSLDGSRIAAKGIKSLSELPTIRHLRLAGCNAVNDNAIEILPSFRKLERLELNACQQITDTGMTHIARIEGLKSLDITSCTSISDLGLTSLASLKNLREIRLNTQTSKITRDGINRLKEKLPELRVVNEAKSS